MLPRASPAGDTVRRPGLSPTAGVDSARNRPLADFDSILVGGPQESACKWGQHCEAESAGAGPVKDAVRDGLAAEFHGGR